MPKEIKYKIGEVVGQWTIIDYKYNNKEKKYIEKKYLKCKCVCGLEKYISVNRIEICDCVCNNKYSSIKVGETKKDVTLISQITPGFVNSKTIFLCRCNRCGLESKTSAKTFLYNKKGCKCYFKLAGTRQTNNNDNSYNGKVFNNIRVIGRSDKHKRVYYKCECVKCNHVVYLQICEFKKIYNCPKCKVAKKHEVTYHKYNLIWYRLIRGAEERGLIFDVTKDYIFDLLEKQNYKCAYTGKYIYLPKEKQLGEYTASLDRIDNSLGYIKGNLQWIHKDINRLKWKWSEEQLLNMVNEIYNHKIKGINNEPPSSSSTSGN